MAKKTPFFDVVKKKPNGIFLFHSAWQQGFLRSFLKASTFNIQAKVVMRLA